MNAPGDPATAWIFASCFGMSVVSAVLPWLNGELVVLSLAALVRSPLDLAVLAVLAAAGQMAGKCALYGLGSQAARLDAAQNARLQRWRDRLCGRGLRALALVFLSSTVGVPPLYLTTIAAGTLGMPFPRFFGAAACGRLVRFTAVVFCPRLVMGLLGRA